MNEKKKLPSCLAPLRASLNKDLGDAIFDCAEVALDSVLSDGVLQELPGVGMMVKAARALQQAKQDRAVNQLMRFIAELKTIAPDERDAFMDKYGDTPEEQQALGETLWIALDRLDDIEKPAILARFFAAYMLDYIDKVTFSRLVRALDRFNMELLPHLRFYYTREGPAVQTPEELMHELSIVGLVTINLADSGTLGGAAHYMQSELGKTFLRIGFDAAI